MGIQINGNTNNINAGIGSLSIEDINELDVTGVVTARSGIKVLAGGINAVGVTTFSSDVYANEGIFLPDTKALKIGNTEGTPDFTISHDTSNTILDNNTGDLILRSDGDDVKILAEDDIVLRDNDDSTNFIHCVNGGGVKLYNNGTQIFETYSSGVTVSGGQVNVNPSSGNATLQLKSGSGAVYTNIHFRAADNTQTSYITSWSGGNLYFGTTTSLISTIGGTEIAEVTSTGFHPKTDSSRDLGKTGTRWANVYADTLYGDGSNLSNLQSFDDNNIVNDISALALKVSALENSAASNTNSTYVDTFQDSNGIASFTNTVRNTSGDYVSSIAPKSFYKPSNDLWTFVQSATNVATNGQCTFAAWMKSANGSNWAYNGSQGGGIMNFQTKDDTSKYLVYNIGYGANNGKFGAHTPGVSDCNTTNSWSAPANKWVLGIVRTGYNWSTGHVEIMHRAYDAGNYTTDADSNGGTSNYGTLASGAGKLFKHNSNGYTGDYDNTYIAMMGFWNQSLNGTQIGGLFNNGKPFDWSQNNGNYTASGNLQEYFKMDEGSGTTLTNSGNGGNATRQSGSGSWDSDTQQIGSANATGNFISNTITASSSTNKMGVVITYIDTSGTATLNTDLKVSLSANNGSNYTQVTLVAQPNFATGVKMALANDVTVTAGTQLKYKVEFANQASNSKETRVTGISLQY